ncbi:MAG: hypothetical protein K0U78_04170 [Actinomycetia bacterium]|nr:hypothetical protein [Actinomycetes bacterium]
MILKPFSMSVALMRKLLSPMQDWDKAQSPPNNNTSSPPDGALFGRALVGLAATAARHDFFRLVDRQFAGREGNRTNGDSPEDSKDDFGGGADSEAEIARLREQVAALQAQLDARDDSKAR